MGKKFVLAGCDRVEELRLEVDEVLQALEHEEALVTDESEIYDFIGFFLEPEEKEAKLEELRDILKVNIVDDFDLIIDVAQRLKDKKNG